MTILGNEFIITIKLKNFKPSPKITIFWVIFIGFFLTFNTFDIAHRLFKSVSELQELLNRLLNQEELIIKWHRKIKNKGNAIYCNLEVEQLSN